MPVSVELQSGVVVQVNVTPPPAVQAVFEGRGLPGPRTAQELGFSIPGVMYNGELLFRYQPRLARTFSAAKSRFSCDTAPVADVTCPIYVSVTSGAALVQVGYARVLAGQTQGVVVFTAGATLALTALNVLHVYAPALTDPGLTNSSLIFEEEL